MSKPMHNLEELEEAAKNRFTADDVEYSLELNEQDLIPPIVSDWSSGDFDRKRHDRSRDDNRDYGKRHDYGRSHDRRYDNRDDRRSNWDRNNRYGNRDRGYDRYSNRH